MLDYVALCPSSYSNTDGRSRDERTMFVHIHTLSLYIKGESKENNNGGQGAGSLFGCINTSPPPKKKTSKKKTGSFVILFYTQTGAAVLTMLCMHTARDEQEPLL